MSVYERRRAILKALYNRKFDRRVNLANEFGVSIRTIDNDITYLSLTYPIYTSRGKYGGVFIDKNFKLNKLNAEELEFLSKMLPMLTAEDNKALKEIIKKLRSTDGI